MQKNFAPVLAAALRSALNASGNREIAARQYAYMKWVQPFHGVTTTERRRLLRDALETHPVLAFETWQDNILELWNGKRREERYLALDLALRMKTWNRDALPLFKTMLEDADWWDVLDPLATGLLAAALRERRALLGRNVRTWRESEHLWTRRAALLVQLKYRSDTDVALLAETVLKLASDQDFFIRKAIGWALREYAKTDPRWVKRLVTEHENTLSPLSRREALKHVGNHPVPQSARSASG